MSINNINRGGQIAVIIPIYNAEGYLSECLDSLIAQTYPNWIAYCVDDGSKDRSYEILNEYAQKDKRIKAFRKANGGASSARNFALDKVEDEDWLSFVDADDFVSPFMYETIMNAIDRYENVDYVRLYCQHTSLRYQDYVSEGWPTTASTIISDISMLTPESYFVEGQVGGYTHSLFVKREIVNNGHIRFFNDMRVLEDQVFSITCATLCNDILLLRGVKNYFYFSGNENSITKMSKDSSEDIIRCINRVFDAFDKMGNEDIERNYFYSQYLPGKLDSLYSQRLHNTSSKVSVRINDSIRIEQSTLSYKTKVKSMLVKLLCKLQ